LFSAGSAVVSVSKFWVVDSITVGSGSNYPSLVARPDDLLESISLVEKMAKAETSIRIKCTTKIVKLLSSTLSTKLVLPVLVNVLF